MISAHEGTGWDENLYFKDGGPQDFGRTWPFFGDLTSWQALGKDRKSLVGVDPLFADAGAGDFRLHSTSPALIQLGFREWDHSGVGPACHWANVSDSVVCP